MGLRKPQAWFPRVIIGNRDIRAMFNITSSTPTSVGQRTKAIPGQTGRMAEWMDANEAILTAIDANGRFFARNIYRGTHNSGGGIGGGALWTPTIGFPAGAFSSAPAIVCSVWGGGENNQEPGLIEHAIQSATKDSFVLRVRNASGSFQVLYANVIAIGD